MKSILEKMQNKWNTLAGGNTNWLNHLENQYGDFSENWESIDAQLMKTQRQILGFNLKTRKVKKPATDSYSDRSLKW